jgi:2-oxoglutarate dehydrogenase E1 component
MFDQFGINAGFVEDLHARYLQSPQSVDEKWRRFFESQQNGGQTAAQNGGQNGSAALAVTPPTTPPTLAPPPDSGRNGPASTRGVAAYINGTAHLPQVISRDEQLFATAAGQARVFQLVNAYRVRGHLFAHLDPLGQPPAAAPELDLGNFGFSAADLDVVFPTAGVTGLPPKATLREIVAHLTETYCRSIGVEFTHIEEPDMRIWLQERMESARNRAALAKDDVLRILTKLTDAEVFETFIHKNYTNAKRFSVEGAESTIALLDLLIDEAGKHGVAEIILGMAHRGRLNVLCNIMGKHPREIFAAFDDKQPERWMGAGDVKYHLGYSTDRVTESGRTVHLSLAFNPSHLEWVNPVVEGRVRAKMDRDRSRDVMPLLIHGDAAFMGQGVVPETLNLAGLEGYATGGTVHVVLNNQIGFTTLPSDARSTRYCTDVCRMMKVPVFHVNGEDPEAVIQVTRLAIEFRQRYHKDVVIDVFCYRKYGHNEGDEPRFTQPLMYALIDRKPTVRQMYVQRLVGTNQITQEQADAIEAERKSRLESALEDARKGDFNKKPSSMEGVWSSYYGGPDHLVPEVTTGVPKARLLELLGKLAEIPPGVTPHPKAHAALENRKKRAETQGTVMWDAGETLAYATLLTEGHPVRLSGQDARRGTFSHRHAVLYDTKTGERYTPLNSLGGAPFQVYDSPLSEAGVLGFEYGYSLDCPEGLILWEAQFGDFLNCAQVIVDQFFISAEDKWNRLSGLTLLLPHGYEGQGPEHSSARLERFLTQAAEDNIQVTNPTTPAQIFHLLRRQVLRPIRKPLVVLTPKSLLRLPEANSPLDELTTGTFRRVITDDAIDPKKTKRVLLCTGKVYYDLAKRRRETGREDVAILRLEQLYPLSQGITDALSVYADGTPLVWVQEEPKNMGAWYFLNARIREHIGTRLPFSLVSRVESASPATGSKASHDLEQKLLLDEAFA